VKGHVRVGAASMGLGRFTDAREAYEKALALDKENEQIQASLKEATTAEESSLRSGNFKFQSNSKGKRPAADGGSAVPKSKKVRDTKLLSFNDDDDDE